MTIADILIFAGTAALLVISPGPNAALIAKTVPGAGRRAGLANVGGFVAAFYVHGALAIFGVSILLVQSAQLYSLVKIAGAVYLIVLGLSALAAFPQFIPDGSSVAAPVALVAVHSAINAVWFSTLVAVFGRIAAAARTVRFKRRIETLTGVIFVGFGGRLAAAD